MHERLRIGAGGLLHIANTVSTRAGRIGTHTHGVAPTILDTPDLRREGQDGHPLALRTVRVR